MIGDAGFRLSVAATAGLLAWATPLGRWIGGLGGGRVPGWLAEGLGISLAAQAATLPDVLVTFGRLSLVAPAVNLAVVPLVPAAMGAGVAGDGRRRRSRCWARRRSSATILGLPGWLLLHVIVAVVRLAAGLPFAAVAIPPGGRRRRRRSRPARGPGRAVGHRAPGRGDGGAREVRAGGRPGGRSAGRPRPRSAPAARRLVPPQAHDRGTRGSSPWRPSSSRSRRSRSATPPARATRLVMLDVGQGDAILVESRGGGRMLVDGGPDPDRLLLELDARVPPWDRRIDLVVLTHPHEDHVAGLVRVLERYRVGRVFEPGMHGPGPGLGGLGRGPAARAAARHARGGRAPPARRGPARRSCGRSPGPCRSSRPPPGRDINDTSIVLLGEANGRRFLLTGDAEDDVDPRLLARGPAAGRRPQGRPPRERHGDAARRCWLPRGLPWR